MVAIGAVMVCIILALGLYLDFREWSGKLVSGWWMAGLSVATVSTVIFLVWAFFLLTPPR